jgi:hypothetical protein
MDRRQLLAGLATSALMSAELPEKTPAYLEVKIWRFHNSAENQPARVAEYLEQGLAPALSRAGGRLDGAFSNVIGPDGPCYTTLTQFASLGAMQDVLAKLAADEEHQRALQKLSAGPGLPFIRVESSLLRSFDGMPQPALSGNSSGTSRIFELRTYESQSFVTLDRKVGMFNSGEMQIFERLGFRPVFFGETIAGPRQPNLTYMLSYDDLAARDRLWRAFISDPEWKKLSSRPELRDSEIVANISNVILAPLKFSNIR